MNTSSRLDILLYCHDGRGIGHASRTVAIGMALRRLYPHLKVLFVSGIPFTRELRDEAPLDWLKLPSYETTVINGKSKGTVGKSNFSDGELGELRAATLAHYVQLYRPRVVLADHSPMGKHRELLPALNKSRDMDTTWVLGVRGVVGRVKQVKSESAAETFRAHYQGLLWYGDGDVLGRENREQLAAMYGAPPVETGYVSRLSELQTDKRKTSSNERSSAGTISIPWLGESSHHLLQCLHEALAGLERDMGPWNIFLPKGAQQEETGPCLELFNRLPNCHARPFGPEYHDALADSKTALIYGGYNSLTDILQTRTPSLVIMRGMQDDEQQEHLQILVDRCRGCILSLAEEEVTPHLLRSHLLRLYHHRNTDSFGGINLCGAEKAAHYLAAQLR